VQRTGEPGGDFAVFCFGNQQSALKLALKTAFTRTHRRLVQNQGRQLFPKSNRQGDDWFGFDFRIRAVVIFETLNQQSRQIHPFGR
jgi:hypothetical protein